MTSFENWYEEIHLIGVGGIGNHVLLALIELGAREIHVWDDDTVAAHNRPNQFMFTLDDIGKPKVEGVQRYVERQGYGTSILAHDLPVVPTTYELSGLVISGVDSMASRFAIWHALREHDYLTDIYIDARIGDEFVHVMTIDPNSPSAVELYEKTLLTREIPDLSCTTRENAYSAFAAAQIVSTNLSLLLAGEPVEEAVYRNLRLESKKKSTRRPSVAPEQGETT